MGTSASRSQRHLASSSGTARSTDTNRGTGGFYLLYLIHRTWAIVISDSRGARSRANRGRGSPSTLTSSSNDSEQDDGSACTCSYCKPDDDFSDCTSDLQFGFGSNMPPNSEDATRVAQIKNSSGQQWLMEEDHGKEKQRPPIYNPEDYALSLRKWGRRSAPANGSTAGGGAASMGLYGTPTAPRGSADAPSTAGQRTNSAPPAAASQDTTPASATGETHMRDYRNPMLTAAAGGEMSLRQFSSVSELLTKLRADLRFAFPSFVQEFIGEPWDGVTLLLELLRGVQLSQAGGTVQRVPPAIQRRALLDELACLQCLLSCCARQSDSIRRLASSPAGLFTLAVCIMSNVNRSRVIALQLLTKACEPPGCGHAPVSESLSTLRLRFGEPVRFRFLVGVLSSSAAHTELLSSGLCFLNAFMMSAGSAQKRLYVQAELEQAGFDPNIFKKIVPVNSPFSEKVFAELAKWEKNIVNIERLSGRADEMERQNSSLREKMKLLERRVKILQEEKGVLLSLERCLKDRCSELQEEVSNSRQIKGLKKNMIRRSSSNNRDGSTPAEDEGISSSERSLSPDDDIQREPMVYEVINVQNDTILINSKKKESPKKTEIDDDDEETTIDEVIEELRNIINDAETEAFEKEQTEKVNNKREIYHKYISNKIQMKVDLIEDRSEIEAEIVPSNLHPQPPRKTKSLVHLFFPNNEPQQFESRQQEIFFEDETPIYTSDEDSDSLLSASKCQNVPRIDRQEIIENSNDNRALLNSIMDARERAEQYERRRQKAKMNELQRKSSSCKRTESFKQLIPNMGLLQIKDANIKSVKHSSVDGLFIVDVNSPTATPITNHIHYSRDNRCKKGPEEVVAEKLKSKSLDRIDEGLDSMVDIVMTSDYNRLETKHMGCHRNRSTTSSRNTPSIVVVGSNAYPPKHKANSYQVTQFSSPDTISTYYEEKHRVFLPNTDFDTDCSHRLILPTDNTNSSSSFSIKRGHTNAGMYSGSQQGKKLISSIPSSDYRSMSPMTPKNSHISGKVTDLPSGLY